MTPRPSTWHVYPADLQVAVADPARVVRKLGRLGVTLAVCSDGVLLVRGPSTWFVYENLQLMGERVAALGAYLGPRYTPTTDSVQAATLSGAGDGHVSSHMAIVR